VDLNNIFKRNVRQDISFRQGKKNNIYHLLSETPLRTENMQYNFKTSLAFFAIKTKIEMIQS